MDTHDPRVKVVSYGRRIWRTLVQYECDPGWHITGPVYLSKTLALARVDDTARRHYGDDRVEKDKFRREVSPGVTVLLDESLTLMMEINGERRTVADGDAVTAAIEDARVSRAVLEDENNSHNDPVTRTI